MDDSMLELVGQVAAYSGVGLGILAAGFVVMDLLTPGSLGSLLMERNRGAAILSASTLVSLGLILYFAIHFTGAGWDGLDDAAVFGAVGVGIQTLGFVVLDLLTPGRLGEYCVDDGVGTAHPAAWVAGGVQIAVALIVCASLT